MKSRIGELGLGVRYVDELEDRCASLDAARFSNKRSQARQ